MRSALKLQSISIIGSSSGRNAGDAALLSGIMDSIDNACGRRLLYEIPTYRPDFIYSSYQNRVRAVSMLPWHGTVGMFGLPTLQSVQRCDLNLIYDAMLFDRKLWNPLTNYMPAVRTLLPLAKRAGKLVGLFNCGTGPINTSTGRKMLKAIGEFADFITVRDEESLALLREVGVTNKNVLVTADAALNVAPSAPSRINQIMRDLGLENQTEILAINVNAYLNTWTGLNQQPLTKEKFAEVFAEALDKVRSEIGVPFLFVATQHHDLEITCEVMTRLKAKGSTVLLSNKTFSHYDIRGVFERVSMLVGMRLHSNILCSAALTPICGLAFQKKVSSYYNLLGIPDKLLSFEEFNSQTLARHILLCWASKNRTKAQLERVIPVLRREALRSAQVIQLIDSGLSADQAIEKISREQRAQLTLAVANEA